MKCVFSTKDVACRHAWLLSKTTPDHLFEIVDLDTEKVVHRFLCGHELVELDYDETEEGSDITKDAARQLGKLVWDGIANYHEQIARLRKKLCWTKEEEKQFADAQNVIVQRENELHAILQDNEWECVYFHFVERRIFPMRTHLLSPNFSDRHIRRFVRDALEHTGRYAYGKGWRLLSVQENSIIYGLFPKRSDEPSRYAVMDPGTPQSHDCTAEDSDKNSAVAPLSNSIPHN